MPEGELGWERKVSEYQWETGAFWWLLDSSGLQTRERAEFQMRPPAPLIQSGSWRNGKVLTLIPAPQNSGQTQVKYPFKEFFFLFSPKTHHPTETTTGNLLNSGRTISPDRMKLA